MKPGRIVALVVGCLLLLPGIGTLFAGGALGLAYTFGRDDAGYFDLTLDRLETPTVAVTAEDVALNADPGSPNWLVDVLDADVRLRVTSADSARDVFVGIGPEADVSLYLAGVAHDEVSDLDGRTPEYRNRSGSDDVVRPTELTFWVASATGPGTQEVDWEATSGRWAVVVMNADGSPGVAADVNVGVKSGIVLPLALVLLGVGALLTAGAVVLIVVGASGERRQPHELPPPGIAGVAPAPQPVGAAAGASPLTMTARLDPDLSRWQWLVKWFLAIPHVVVLIVLWIAFAVLTVVAGFSILFTGRYPRGIFDFNVGVLRWSWRVSYYAWHGGIGTDRYPPFSLAEDPEYPATLNVTYPTQLSRGLVLVKWWLLAIPHYLIVGLLIGGSVWWFDGDSDRVDAGRSGGGGLLGVLVVIAGVILLFTNRYPHRLFDLIVGLNRWVYRVIVYAALMSDRYPPFQLDQGGSEPVPTGPEPETFTTGG